MAAIRDPHEADATTLAAPLPTASGSGHTVMWVGGRLASPTEHVLRPDDHGLVGDGAFEAIKVLDGQPFALTRHLRRLAASAAPLGIEVDEETMRRATRELMATPQARASPSWLRLTVTGGSAPMGTGRLGAQPTVIAAVTPMAAWRPTTAVVIAPWTRNEHGATAGLKTISYADNVIGLRHALRLGADEAIFANTSRNLCEGTGSNVFVVHENRLATPPLESGCLAGVTRELLLEWMPEIEETDLPIGALQGAREAFLTSTSRDLHPIASVDGVSLTSAPGAFTSRAMDVWRRRASESIDP